MATVSAHRPANYGAIPTPGTNDITFPVAPGRQDANNPTQNQVPTTRSRVAEIASNNSGMLLIALSQFFFAFMNVCVKKLNSIDPPVSALELIWVRMAITWTCCLLYMKFAGVPDPILGPKEVRWFLALRGFFGFVGLFGIYYSLQYLSLSDSTVLTFLAPMCATVTGALFLGEGFAWSQAAAGFSVWSGVTEQCGWGHRAGTHTFVEVNGCQCVTSAALLGVLGATGAYTTIRAIGKRAHAMHNLVAFSTQCVIGSTIAMIIFRTPVVIPTRLDWVVMLLAIGILGFIAQVFLTLGLQREAVGRGTMGVYIQIVFATALDQIFFHTTPPFLSVIGTVIIMSSAIYVAVTKENSNR